MERPTIGGGEKALRHIAARLLDEGRYTAVESEAEGIEREDDLEQLRVLAEFFGAKEVIVQVDAALEELRAARLEATLRRLEARAAELEAELGRLAAGRGAAIDLDATLRIQRVAAEVNAVLLDRLVYSMAVEERRFGAGEAEAGKLRKSVEELIRRGHEIQRETVVLPIEEIEALLGIPLDRLLGIIQSRKLQHEGRRVFLDLKALARLIVVAG